MSNSEVEAAVQRNCEALVSGNYTQIFMDLTPQAMAKFSQMAATQMGTGAPPKLTGYTIVGRATEGDEEVYDVRFHGDVEFGVKAHWKQIDGQWKIADAEPYQG